MRTVAVACVAALLPSCIASNVVAVQDRAVVQAVDRLQWTAEPATVLTAGGLFESVRISGEAAAHLRKVYYLFEPGDRYTAAALIAGDGGSAFQTLEGTWRLRGRELVLDDGDPIAVRAAPEDYLELAAPTGAVVLHRVPIE